MQRVETEGQIWVSGKEVVARPKLSKGLARAALESGFSLGESPCHGKGAH